ncbi:large ribosomal subunit protein bL27m isoform X2 [Lepus europaeus]|uniref:large ribosomal subunit protein bL27m isoform X2 n=1 Tax=Lepus europaeus TaxID=9983 RepID=UPI002B45D11C|nr:large ribosomal subunit protein bL27m isoform X2 [Lepus europaeus]
MAAAALALRTRAAAAALLSPSPAAALAVRYASKKTGGSSKNLGGKAPGKRFGIKKLEGHYVHAGNILGTQRQFRWHPGAHVRGPKHLGHLPLLSQAISRDQQWSSWDVNWCPHGMPVPQAEPYPPTPQRWSGLVLKLLTGCIDMAAGISPLGLSRHPDKEVPGSGKGNLRWSPLNRTPRSRASLWETLL